MSREEDMAKRVKKGFDELLYGRVRACEVDGHLRLSHIANGCEDVVELPAAACEALGMTAVLEDVPEPWERVRDALHQAAKDLGRTSAHPVYQLPSDVLVRAAELLGIKPEGES